MSNLKSLSVLCHDRPVLQSSLAMCLQCRATECTRCCHMSLFLVQSLRVLLNPVQPDTLQYLVATCLVQFKGIKCSLWTLFYLLITSNRVPSTCSKASSVLYEGYFNRSIFQLSLATCHYPVASLKHHVSPTEHPNKILLPCGHPFQRYLSVLCEHCSAVPLSNHQQSLAPSCSGTLGVLLEHYSAISSSIPCCNVPTSNLAVVHIKKYVLASFSFWLSVLFYFFVCFWNQNIVKIYKK